MGVLKERFTNENGDYRKRVDQSCYGRISWWSHLVVTLFFGGSQYGGTLICISVTYRLA